jgi:hypothetical protein
MFNGICLLSAVAVIEHHNKIDLTGVTNLAPHLVRLFGFRRPCAR